MSLIPSHSCKAWFTDILPSLRLVKVVFCFRDSARALAPSTPILFPENEQTGNEQTRTDSELDSITQLQRMVPKVLTYIRDSDWSRSCSASETRLGPSHPRRRYYSLKINRLKMNRE